MALQPEDAEGDRTFDSNKGDGPFNGRLVDNQEQFEDPARDAMRIDGSGATTEPLWVVVSIPLGLLALSGSILMFVLAGIAAIIVWLARTPPLEGPQQGWDPFGGPTSGPGIWP